jgi:transcriptional regulator NrdR family protein
MNCTNPACDNPKIRVESTIDTGDTVLRIRRCQDCGWRVTTKEDYAEQQSIPATIRRPREQYP